MLEPREADIPALFLFLVVLPLVTYFLLGKWNEASRKNARISMLAQLAAEEALRVEAMATASIIPPVVKPPSKTGLHQCARCNAPATTRCSRCKSVRYCSGNCQIIHWRQGHRLECWQRDEFSPAPNVNFASLTESSELRTSVHENMKPASDYIQPKIPLHAPCTAATSPDTAKERKHTEKRAHRKIHRDSSKSSETVVCSAEESCSSDISEIHSKEDPVSHKLGENSFTASSEEFRIKQNGGGPPISLRGRPCKLAEQNGCAFDMSSCHYNLSHLDNKVHVHEIPPKVIFQNSDGKEEKMLSLTTESISGRRLMLKSSPHSLDGPAHSQRSSKTCRGPGVERKVSAANEASATPTNQVQDSNGILEMADSKVVAAKQLPRVPKRDKVAHGINKNKVLFPYGEFVQFFQCDVWNLSPRGLLNCGNSCYANAVLQCLTSTKPLIVYLLRGSHSRNCRERDWCLMCELEQHVSNIREGGGPLSPSQILACMRFGCRMGAGNQEDAHEFLRLLVASMQSVCLEGLGGEKEIDPRLQETTFIQHTFGGRLRSEVKCLRCQHESERYENIMDLTLEILGWVESLEDALAQFTSPEDLDGENMYRCGSCAAYVKARKQLSVHEAPNILTIVLKRFQTGKYGKINKCITFPDMLDMNPYMTDNGDSPPLYMLYGVVVHLDTLNASFSGHYVSYVKDLRGTWFRIDDTQVEPVPLSQVMLEGAYILFYSRSYPRPPRGNYHGKSTSIQAPPYVKHPTSKPQKLSNIGHATKGVSSLDHPFLHPTSNEGIRRSSLYPAHGRNYADPTATDYSDATSSDWSLFTSSDESSFTTESTRDSFSTVDYSDTLGGDPVSSLFGTFCFPEYNSNRTVSCKKYSPCRPLTRYFSESRGSVLASSVSGLQPGDCVHKEKNLEQVSVSSVGPSPGVPGSNCSRSVRYGTSPKGHYVQTSSCCEL